ncbi:MAG: NAD(P)H-hydrate dehydratase [Acidimicrobiales bacterium]
MIPVVTVGEMRALDEQAHREVGLQVLVERAGYAVAYHALKLLHGGYGRRVLVVAGKGNNGEDGRVAARILRDRGVMVEIVSPGVVADEAVPAIAQDMPSSSVESRVQQPLEQTGQQSEQHPEQHLIQQFAVQSTRWFDLVIDAAYGTGFHGTYEPPVIPEGVPVLAVDIPSGVHGDTGEASGNPLQANQTVVMAAIKPGLLQGDGARLSGRLEVAGIGIDASRVAGIHLIEDSDVRLPERGRSAHKWESAVCMVAGSPGMTGAASMCAKGALRAGAGMVRWMSTGAVHECPNVPEVVSVALDGWPGWSRQVLDESARCRSAVIGPGIGRSPEIVKEIRQLVRELAVPMVLDADGLYALGTGEEAAALIAERHNGDSTGSMPPMILTPHDGEAARLAGYPMGDNRIEDARRLAASLGAIVLLKGSTTVVADPGGPVYVVTSGSPRLATAGTGDVLAGIIGAFLARDAGSIGDGTRMQQPALAAALAAHVHGRASWLGWPTGLAAMDLPDFVAVWLSSAEARTDALQASDLSLGNGMGGMGGMGARPPGFFAKGNYYYRPQESLLAAVPGRDQHGA